MLLSAFLLGVVTALSVRVPKMGDHSIPDISPSCGPFPHKRVVMVSFSASYFDFLTNWFATSTKFLGDDDVVVVVAEDQTALSLITENSTIQRLGRPFAVMDMNSQFVQFPMKLSLAQVSRRIRGDWGSTEYKRVTKGKPGHILALLQQGCTVHWTDIDAVWTERIWGEIASTGSHDLYVTDDSEQGDWPQGTEWNLCTCQMYIQPTKNVIRLFQAWIQACLPEFPFDQSPFNIVLKRDHDGNKTVDFVVLDRAKFPPSFDLSDAAKVIHANWYTSSDEKREFLHQNNVWFPLTQE